MNEPLSDYARLGLVHHMLYGEDLGDPARHAASLAALSGRNDIETFDCCLPYGDAYRKPLIPLLRASGKQHITFATHLYPLRKLSFASTSAAEQGFARLVVADMVAQAAAIGATGFILPSGGPAPAEATQAHRDAFAGFLRWLCAELKPHGMVAMLEPFDTTIDKCFLYGPTADCVALIESLRPEVDNLGIELDLAHVPLMGETFAGAIRTVAPHLKRVHLGNCVLKDRQHPRYGDTHPPIGYPGGEIDVPETAEILRGLLEVGFLNPQQRGDLVIEMTVWPGKTVDETVADNLARVHAAWKQVRRH